MEIFIDLLTSEKGLRILVVLLGVLLYRLFVDQLSNKVLRISEGRKQNGKRLRTITSIFQTFSSVTVILIGLFMILKEVGFDITPLLASAGVIGLAVGFGAQTLIKDVISGFFLILEGQFNEGDRVEINGKKGVVEKINLRTVSLRGEKNEIHIIPNGSINLVTNFSKADWITNFYFISLYKTSINF